MLGKLIGMFVGRSMAKKRGYSGLAGAAAGLVAPTLIKHGASLISKAGSAVLAARRRERETNYLPSAISPGRGELSSLLQSESGPVASGKAGTDKKFQDPKTYEKYDAAMGDLRDAGGAASIAGPTV